MRQPQVNVIIPSDNRHNRFAEAIVGLRGQTLPLIESEILSWISVAERFEHFCHFQ